MTDAANPANSTPSDLGSQQPAGPIQPGHLGQAAQLPPNGSSDDGTRPPKQRSHPAYPFLLGAALVVIIGLIFFRPDAETATPVTTTSCDQVDGNADCPETDDKQAVVDTRTPVWAEEFDQLDPSRWVREHSTFGDGNNELQCYQPEQVTVANGILVLKAEDIQVTCPNGSVRSQTSGMVRSQGLTLSPGQSIEWRVKLTPANADAQAGLWPALWSSSWAGGGWPTGGEWDGFEVMTANSPDRVSYGIHYSNASGSHAKSGNEVFGARFSDDWHDFRFDYGVGGVLVWYMDGVETHRVVDAPTQQGYPAPFDQTMTEIKINLALGGNPGALEPSALPATYEIDYIRVYTL